MLMPFCIRSSTLYSSVITILCALIFESCSKKKTEPTEERTIRELGMMMEGGAVHVEKDEEGYAYVSKRSDGFSALSLVNPESPLILAEVKTGVPISKFRHFGRDGVAIDQNSNLIHYDISDRTRPRQVTQFGLAQINDVARDVMLLEVNHEVTLIVGSQYKGLAGYREVDGVQIPLNLLEEPSFGLINQLESVGSYIFATDYHHGFFIFDIEEWPVVRRLAHVDLGVHVAGMTVGENGKVWLSALDKGFFVVDVTDVNNPQPSFVMSLPGLVHDTLPLNDNRLLIAHDNLSNEYGLSLVEIEENGVPRVIEHLKTKGTVRSLAQHGGYVYAADDTEGLKILTIQGFTELESETR